MLREGAVKEGKPVSAVEPSARALGPVPVSAAGCSESCCPVIRCRQTCWELWRLAWSMLEWENKRKPSVHTQQTASSSTLFTATAHYGAKQQHIKPLMAPWVKLEQNCKSTLITSTPFNLYKWSLLEKKRKEKRNRFQLGDRCCVWTGPVWPSPPALL